MKVFLSILLAGFGAAAWADCPINVDEWAGKTTLVWVNPSDPNEKEIRETGRDWPATDPDGCVCPDCGIIPNFEIDVYALREIDAPLKPVYDSDYYTIQRTHVFDVPNMELRVAWATTKRAELDLVSRVEGRASQRLREHVPHRKLMLYTPICLTALWRLQASSPVPQKYLTLCDKYAAMVTNRVLQDQDNLAALIADIELGLEPDMNVGWSVVVPGDMP